MDYKLKAPCKNCPYRIDAPLAHWDIIHFKQVLVEDKLQFGKIFGCHKNDNSICRGYLMSQQARDYPNINLRLSILTNRVSARYLNSLFCPVPLFDSIEDMAEANFPTIFLELDLE